MVHGRDPRHAADAGVVAAEGRSEADSAFNNELRPRGLAGDGSQRGVGDGDGGAGG